MTVIHTVEAIAVCLAELPDLCALLPDAAITRTPEQHTSRPVPSSRPPARLDVLHLLDTRPKDSLDYGWYPAAPDPDRTGVLPYLWSWCRDLEADMLDHSPVLPADLPDRPTVVSCCGWIGAHLGWAVTRPQWPDMADGIHTTHRRARDATRHVRDRETDDVTCQRCEAGRLARVPGERPLWRCEACGAEVAIRAVTLRQAGQLLGIPKTSLQRLASRAAILTPVSESPGRRLYDLGQIQRLADQTRGRGTGA